MPIKSREAHPERGAGRFHADCSDEGEGAESGTNDNPAAHHSRLTMEQW